MGKVANSRPWLKDLIYISVIMFFLHGFIMVLTGTFHDDWLSLLQDAVTKDMEGFESGRPYYSFIIKLVWGLPGYSYRILIYITYWLSYLFTYGMLSNINELSRRDALLITIITMAAPINDARVLLANYPYALGMLFFFAAAFVLVRYTDKLDNLLVRLGALCFFFLSFTLNSNLVLYAVVLLYIVMRERWKTYKYMDFFLIPFVFYFLNKKLFPVYGAYKDYNVVTWDRMKWALTNLPEIFSNTIISVVRLLAGNHIIAWIALGSTMAVLLSCYLYRKGGLNGFLDTKEHAVSRDRITQSMSHCSVLIFLFGILFLVAGVFPYAVIRQNPVIHMVGIAGRDSINIGLGIALLCYGGINRRLHNGFIVFFVLAAFLHLNSYYLSYQTEWYRQLAFQKKVASIEDIQNGGNFIVNCTPKSMVNDRRFYTWSGNTAVATGKRNVFMLNGTKDASILKNAATMNMVLSHYPMYKDYCFDHSTVDGIVLYSAGLSRKKTFLLKLYEIFDKGFFEKEINSIGTLKYLPKR